jgi:NDP-sugar pyrophosphorylase family protein
MTDSLAGVVLGAGFGTRLRPLTTLRPKVLCPVGGVALVDHALTRVGAVTDDLAVNVHHGREQMEAHLEGRVHLSIEEPEPLGTAGALGQLRPWIDGRPVVVVNGDTWCAADLRPLVDGWDGERTRVLLVGGGPLGPRSLPAGALLPGRVVAGLAGEPSGLFETAWLPDERAGRLEVVAYEGPFFDCGTPRRYLAANLAASGGAPVVGEGAVVDGIVERTVVWAGATVYPHEHLIDGIRTETGMTVLVR